MSHCELTKPPATSDTSPHGYTAYIQLAAPVAAGFLLQCGDHGHRDRYGE
jgi:hypothetical protein